MANIAIKYPELNWDKSILLTFAGGGFDLARLMPSNSNTLWSIIGAAAELEDKVFFEIEREDTGLKFQGYGEGQRFCLFQDTYQHEIKLFGTPLIDQQNLDLVQIWDMRWELTYFLPKAAFCDFEDMVALGTRSLQSGELEEHVILSQSFPDLGLPDGYC